MLRKLLVLCMIIMLPTLAFIESIYVDGENEGHIGERQALYIKAPIASDYVRIEREVEEINISSDDEYAIELLIKVLSHSTDEPGVIFRLDLLDSGENVKFSIRLTNDKGVLFYYPSSSLIAFKQENAWSIGSWNKFGIVLSRNSTSFYVNGNLVGRNLPKYPALSCGYGLSRIRFGETDARALAFEGFIDYFGIRINGEPIFYEDFDNGLEDYRISKSENSIVEVINAEAYTKLSLEADTRSVTAGDTLRLTCVLKDSYGESLPNKTVHLQYSREGRTVDVEMGNTSADGSLEYTWKVPKEPGGHIELCCEFIGDDFYSGSTSSHMGVFIKHEPNIFQDNRFVAFVLAAWLALFFIYSSRQFGLEKSSAYLFIASEATGVFFLIVTLTNLLGIEYHLAYSPRTVNIELISQTADALVWVASFVLSFIAIFISRERARSRLPNVLALAYLGLLASFFFFISGSRLIGAIIAFLASISLVLVSIYHAKSFLSISRAQVALGFLIVPSSILLSIELCSVAGWILNAFDPHVPFDGSSRWFFSIVEVNFSNILYPLTPFLLIGVLLSWVWIPLITIGSKRVRFPSYREGHAQSSKIIKLLEWPILLTSVACALFVSYYPYFYFPRLAGVDAPWYHAQLINMTDWNSAFKILTGPGAARGAYLLMLFLLKLLTGLSADSIIKIGPALPASFLALTTYLLVSTGTKDRSLALLSSFLAAFSVNTTVGVFAATFANWLALSWAMLLLVVLLYAPKKGLKSSIPLAFLLSCLVLVTHPWTWVFLMGTLLTYSAITLIYRFFKKDGTMLGKTCLTALAIIPINFVLAFSFFLVTPNSEFIRLSYLVWHSISIDRLFTLMPTLNFTIKFYVGGFFGNPNIYLFAVLGAFMLKDLKNEFNRLIVSILLPASILSILVDQFWQWRILYVVPYQIMTALGLAFIIYALKKVLQTPTGFSNAEKNLLNILQGILVLLLILSQFNYALRCMNYIIPS